MGASERPRLVGRLLLAGVVLCAVLELGAGISKEAVANIQCQVCELAVEEARAYARESKPQDEDGFVDLVDGLCSARGKAGRWVARLDITREGSDGPLKLAKRDGIGSCKSECLTVQRACSAALKGQEETLVEQLQKGKGAKEMKNKLCKKLCKRTPPKLEKWIDEPFVARNAEEVETEDMLESLRAETGMGMKTYNREELLGMSDGDKETLAAREAGLLHHRQAAKMANVEM